MLDGAGKEVHETLVDVLSEVPQLQGLWAGRSRPARQYKWFGSSNRVVLTRQLVVDDLHLQLWLALSSSFH